MPALKKKPVKRKKANIKIPVTPAHKPSTMNNAEWQTALRRQLAEKEIFEIKKLGDEPVYSDYNVYSPNSKNTYKIALRSKDNSLNFCSCPDFKTNLLGTCKHIEAVRLLINKKRGIKKLVDNIPVLAYSSLYVSYPDERKIRLRIGSENKKEFEKWRKKYFDKEYTLLPAAYNDIEKLLSEAVEINPAFRCYEDALQLIVEYREKWKRQDMIGREGRELLKGLVNIKLFPYQEEGILFAANAGRAILADDMGLGKTVQAISWAMLLYKFIYTEKVLIVCPTSLKYQWKTEIEKFTGITAVVIEGNVMARKQLYENNDSYFKIVSYQMAGNDWALINQMQPEIVILDEAQRIKNWKAKISQNIKRIKSKYALVLTGTPLENNIEELYSLVQYINPFILGSLHHFLSAHQVKNDDTGKITGYTGLNEIGKKLTGTLLRRTKKEVLKQLPGRMDKVLFVPLTDEQRGVHTEYADYLAKLVSKWKRQGFLNEQDRQNLMIFMNTMRMVCDSTYVVDQETNHQTKLDELFNILDELFTMVGEKVVIFSQWERMTRLVAMGLTDRKVKFEYLHGGVPSKKRESLFKNFNADPDCKVFLSTDAGGVGLNLQVASNLINLDIPWNPAVLEQRIARIYRLGQKKNVSIINLVAQDSIEERMLGLLKFKTSVAAGILDNGEDSIFMGDDRFKQFMQSVESMTQDITPPAAYTETEEQDEAITETTPQNMQEDAFEALITEPELPQPELAQAALAFNAHEPTEGANELVQNGMQFLSKLVTALSNPDSIKQLAGSITEKDEKTGKTYLKLPVDNTETVEKALNLVGKLLNSFGK